MCAFIMAALLFGCAEDGLAPDPPLLRNPTVPFGGTSRFDVRRFAGDWTTSACIGECAAQVSYAWLGGRKVLRQAEGLDRVYEVTAPGILRTLGGDQILVVMWVDEGFRTAAVGDADGRWAAVIDRAGQQSADRTRAAEEILDFNGWDAAKLRKIKE
ncbi:MAG: hypothetical protein HKN30_14230 [Sulfitobacter sp.]|nr:hypothetical protein [Sulfitobacter sp.]